RTIDENLAIIASFPELKGKPIVIGESDPDGCAACQGPQLGYRNMTMYRTISLTTAGGHVTLGATGGPRRTRGRPWWSPPPPSAFLTPARPRATASDGRPNGARTTAAAAAGRLTRS